MKVEQLGRITELPKPNESDSVKLLIIHETDLGQYIILKAKSDGNNNNGWAYIDADILPNEKNAVYSFTNSVEATLITFEPPTLNLCQHKDK